VKGHLVVVDADSLGRQRTGDETYVASLLEAMGRLAEEVRVAAVTRRPDLVPAGIDAVPLRARSQELRMALSLPRKLRSLHPALVHSLHVLPPRLPCPGVLTIQDLSFERDPTVQRPWERLVFRTMVPRSARRAAHVLAISERTRDDLVELYGLPAERITVTPLGVDPVFAPDGAPAEDSYLLLVGAIERRKDPLAAAEAARQLGRRLVVAGPTRDRERARELERRGADLRGYVPRDELARLYRGAACLLAPSRYEGFGLTVVEAMACGTPVVAAPDAALREVAGDAAVFAPAERLADGIRAALADRPRLAAAGRARAARFTWDETARLTLAVYRDVLARQ
jgi:glycosyltransferase involved in cell wall biosynthesis